MNRRNDWKNVLRIANNDLKQYGYSLLITEPEDEGFYFLEIWKNGTKIDDYAGNFYENELEDLIDEAWEYVKSDLC